MAFLFSPERVASVLAGLPSLAATLPSPDDEGVASVAFPALRKTDREIYRFLANNQYDHLVEALAIFERVFAAGCVLRDLVTTTGRQQFKSTTAEALVAEHFLGRGYGVRAIPRTNAPGADLRVTGRGFDVAVEVYSPREWMAFDVWTDAVKDLIMDADVPGNYRGGGTTAVRATTPPDRVLTTWEVAEILEQTQDQVIEAISRDFYEALDRLEPFEATYDHGDSDLSTTFSIENVTASRPGGPTRSGNFSRPGPSGYSPAGVFRTVVARAEKKAWKRQTLTSDAPTRALLVNLMYTEIGEDLIHPAHNAEATKALEGFDPTRAGLDFVAFYVRALPSGIRHVFTVFENETITEAQIVEMLGDPDTATG